MDEGESMTTSEKKRQSCEYIEMSHVLPGWACCQCNHYNGAWREFCRTCKHRVCIELPADKVAESTKMAAAAQGLSNPRP